MRLVQFHPQIRGSCKKSAAYPRPTAHKNMGSLHRASTHTTRPNTMQPACFVPSAGGFRLAAQPRRATSARTPTMTTLRRTQLAAKSFQLEEMEDSANQTSAMYLAADGSVHLGQTDGPTPDRAKGKWSFTEPEGLLEIEIERWFGADSVPFSVKRLLRGHPDDGNSGLALFVGAMFRDPTDFGPEEALGHFAMVEATDDLRDVHYDISKNYGLPNDQ